MITEKDLKEAILECQGVRNPTADTCIKLASYFTIKDAMFGEKVQYSQQPPKDTDTINFDSGSEFSDMIYGKRTEDVLEILDEAMTTLQVVNPNLYKAIMRKLDF